MPPVNPWIKVVLEGDKTLTDRLFHKLTTVEGLHFSLEEVVDMEPNSRKIKLRMAAS